MTMNLMIGHEASSWENVNKLRLILLEIVHL